MHRALYMRYRRTNIVIVIVPHLSASVPISLPVNGSSKNIKERKSFRSKWSCFVMVSLHVCSYHLPWLPPVTVAIRTDIYQNRTLAPPFSPSFKWPWLSVWRWERHHSHPWNSPRQAHPQTDYQYQHVSGHWSITTRDRRKNPPINFLRHQLIALRHPSRPKWLWGGYFRHTAHWLCVPE